MEEKSNIGWIVVAIIAIVAIVGLVLLFKASITGNIAEEQIMPTAGKLGLRCTCVGPSSDILECVVPQDISNYPIPAAARICAESGGRLEHFSEDEPF